MFDPRPDLGRPDRGILAALTAKAPKVRRFVMPSLAEARERFEAVADRLDHERAEHRTLGLPTLEGQP